MLSELQHFAFCRRQWALIHIEQQWAENVRTVEGKLMHQRAHDETLFERRGETLTARGMRVVSHELKTSGACDVVEFYAAPDGVTLAGIDGRWKPYPVEYKRGEPKENDADELQLCGQAMCLEEMLVCEIPEGSLYYGATRRRKRVVFTTELRERVKAMLEEMQRYAARGYTPSVRRTKGCNACSLKEICLPGLQKAPRVADYLKSAAREDAP